MEDCHLIFNTFTIEFTTVESESDGPEQILLRQLLLFLQVSATPNSLTMACDHPRPPRNVLTVRYFDIYPAARRNPLRCRVCRDFFAYEDKVAVAYCGHVLHPECIWHLRNTTSATICHAYHTCSDSPIPVVRCPTCNMILNINHIEPVVVDDGDKSDLPTSPSGRERGTWDSIINYISMYANGGNSSASSRAY